MIRPTQNTKHFSDMGAAKAADSTLPARVDRKRGALIITERYFPVSHRTLETWSITWRRVNGRATCDTYELLAVAQAKLDAAPPLLGGKKVGTRANSPLTSE